MASAYSTDWYSRKTTEPAHTNMARAEPRQVAHIDVTSNGTPAISTTSAVPRAEPSIAGAPVSRFGRNHIATEAPAATTASSVESR